MKGYEAPDPTSVEQQIAGLLYRRKKIEAIKLLREHTGLSLADAKWAVEQVEAGRPLPVKTGPARPPWPVERAPAEHVLSEVRSLKYRGRLIEAIRLMRQHTGMGLAEAKDAVDRL